MDHLALARRSLRIGLSASLLCAATLSLAQEPSAKTLPEPTITTRQGEMLARVVELDAVTRRVTFRTPRGTLLTVTVGGDVQGFDKLRIGERAIVRYVAATAVSFARTGRDGIRESVVSTKGEGRTGRRTTEVVAVVQRVNLSSRNVVLKGPTQTVMVEAPADVDLRKLKPGDEVHALIEEAVVLELLPASAQ